MMVEDPTTRLILTSKQATSLKRPRFQLKFKFSNLDPNHLYFIWLGSITLKIREDN